MDASTFRLLTDPTRREILRLIWSGERSAGQIAAEFTTSFGAVSQHLGRLWRGGLVKRRREGRRLYYVADRESLGPLAAALEAMWRDRLDTLRTLAEFDERRSASKRRGQGMPTPREHEA